MNFLNKTKILKQITPNNYVHGTCNGHARMYMDVLRVHAIVRGHITDTANVCTKHVQNTLDGARGSSFKLAFD